MPGDTCYFDGRCGLCRRTTRLLRRLDWFGKLAFVDLTTTPPADLPVPLDEALRGMPLRTGGGRVMVGFPAVRRALLQTPLGLPLAAVLFVPGLAWLGRQAYDRIARHRGRDVCVLPT